MPDQWPRALLRAALREEGDDALGTRALDLMNKRMAPEPGRGAVRLVVLAQEAVTGASDPELEALRAADIPIVLIAPSLRGELPGPWARVLRRPVSVGDVMREIERLLPLPPETRRPLD
jgi:hypothetical protein